MRSFLTILAILIGSFVLVRVGWPAPILIVPGLLILCGLRVFRFTRSETFNARLCMRLGVFLLLAESFAWLFAQILFWLRDNESNFYTRNGIVAFLSDTDALRVFWAVVAGLAVTALFALILLIPIWIGNTRLAARGPGVPAGVPAASIGGAAAELAGANKGVCIVQNSTAQTFGDQASSLETVGGPGTLIVQDGHAVILEKGGRHSRAVGSGIYSLEPYERVAMVAPLTTRMEHLELENVATGDPILLEKFEFWVFHRILFEDAAAAAPSGTPGPSTHAARAPRGSAPRYPFDEDLLFDRVWNVGGRDWRAGIHNVSETAARDVIGRYPLEDLVPLTDQTRTELRGILIEQINRITRPLMGVNVVAVDFGDIQVPAEARDKLLQRQLAGWNAEIAETAVREAEARSQAQARQVKLLEKERADAQERMVEGLGRGLLRLQSAHQDPSFILTMRLIEALEKMAENPATKIVIPTDVLQLLEQVRVAQPSATPGNGDNGDGVRESSGLPLS
jgi:hypothetical protein